MKNVAYIISSVSKSVAFEWIAQELNPSKYKLFFILLNKDETPIERYFKANNIPCYRIEYTGKKSIIPNVFKIRKILKANQITIVHAHLFEASFIGLIAAKISGIKQRIHTRHNATIHHNYFPHAVKYDKFINLLSTDIVAISNNVKKIIVEKENARENKITIIHHGFKLEEFGHVDAYRVEKIKHKHQLNLDGKIVFGVISRYIHWKGVQYIIPAYQKFLSEYPNAHLLLANASGPYKNEITNLLKLLPNESYTEIEFEEDIFALYQCFHFFVHTPIDEESEAFGQVYVETMASKVPSIVTLSGIAADFIAHKKNAWVVPFCDSEAIYQGMQALCENKIGRNQIVEQGFVDVYERFQLNKMIEALENLYERGT